MRDYDPTTGRYLEPDLLGLVDGASVYGYARQNPGRWVDPRGEEIQDHPMPASAVDKFFACVAANDPLNGYWKSVLVGAGAPIPKKVVGLPRGTSGASRFTTLPSVIAHHATGGKARQSSAASAARSIGRGANPGLLAYGGFMFGVEVGCLCQLAFE